MAPLLLALQIVAMELVEFDPELLRRSAHFIHRDETVIDIASGVFHPLCHHRAGQLLELQGKIQLFAVAVDGPAAFTASQQQDVAQEFEHRARHAAVAPSCPGDRFVDMAPVALAEVASFVQVGAIDGETRDGFANRVAQHRPGEVAHPAIDRGDPLQQVAEHVQFAGERRLHDQLLALVDDRLHVHPLAEKALVEIGE